MAKRGRKSNAEKAISGLLILIAIIIGALYYIFQFLAEFFTNNKTLSWIILFCILALAIGIYSYNKSVKRKEEREEEEIIKERQDKVDYLKSKNAEISSFYDNYYNINIGDSIYPFTFGEETILIEDSIYVLFNCESYKLTLQSTKKREGGYLIHSNLYAEGKKGKSNVYLESKNLENISIGGYLPDDVYVVTYEGLFKNKQYSFKSVEYIECNYEGDEAIPFDKDKFIEDMKIYLSNYNEINRLYRYI